MHFRQWNKENWLDNFPNGDKVGYNEDEDVLGETNPLIANMKPSKEKERMV